MTSGMIIVIGLLAFTLVSGLLLGSDRSQGGRSSRETWPSFAPASTGTSNTGVEADRTNGFQGRALVFLAVVAIGAGFVWRRRRR